MQTTADIKIHVDLITGQMRIDTGGIQPLPLACVLSQIVAQLVAQNSAGQIVTMPQRPASVFTNS